MMQVCGQYQHKIELPQKYTVVQHARVWSSVVISQTISWVSQVRLATVARISVFIE